MHKPVTHAVDAATEAPVEMTHHVLHVRADDRFPVLVDLLAAPGRSVVFTRTKRRAKVLTQQLVAAGVPAVELHGNLAQNARNRNLAAFSDGSAETLVATDIAARGIHVDDVALVIHADPPVEHKAYLHRSGRTARAGAQGTVITLMTDDQQAEVRDLTRKAGVRPTTSRTRPGRPAAGRAGAGRARLRRSGRHPGTPADDPRSNVRGRTRRRLPSRPWPPGGHPARPAQPGRPNGRLHRRRPRRRQRPRPAVRPTGERRRASVERPRARPEPAQHGRAGPHQPVPVGRHAGPRHLHRWRRCGVLIRHPGRHPPRVPLTPTPDQAASGPSGFRTKRLPAKRLPAK